MQVVIPAGGRGARFLPLSRFVPKELLLLGDRPLIQHAVEEAVRAGFETAVVVLSPEKRAVRDYLESVDLPLRVEFIEQPEPNGLGDAVLHCWGLVDEPFAVLLPDDVVPGSAHWAALRSVHESTGAAALCLRRVPIAQAGRFGMAACKEEAGHLRVEGLVEKPTPAGAPSDLAILGRYIVSRGVTAALRRSTPSAGTELELTDGFAAALRVAPGVVAVRYPGDVFDCGTPDDYRHSFVRFAQEDPADLGARSDERSSLHPAPAHAAQSAAMP